jgi:DNA excision repair protein ERCC-2
MEDPKVENMNQPIPSGQDLSKPLLPVAVRSLAEATHRQGGLGGPVYGSVSGVEGTRLHQKLARHYQRQLGQAQVVAELRLEGQHECETLILKVSGRCDLLLTTPDGLALVEAKSFSGSPKLLPEGGDACHWAQAWLYGHLLLSNGSSINHASERGQEVLRLGLSYISLETDEIIEFWRVMTKAQLAQFFCETSESFAGLAGKLLAGQRLRDASAKFCTFPFANLRQGQKRLMQEVIGVARQKGVLFAQAPTGTGKTLSVLFPAIRLLAHHVIDRVFYLTAMTSTRRVAEAALQDLRASGLVLRSLTLQAKEKICLKPELFCEVRQCPLATQYYRHLPDALDDLLALGGHCRAEDVRAVALSRQVCPFELSLDFALYCDVIIGDYNYAFDPRVQLERFFNLPDQSHLLLVDEAHNLPDRSREMYSASLDFKLVQQAVEVQPEDQPLLRQSLLQLAAYGDSLAAALAATPAHPEAHSEQTKGFRSVEPDQNGRLMDGEQFCAQTERPIKLLKILGRTLHFCRQFLDDQPDFPERKRLLDLFLAAHFFLRVADRHFGPAYITTAVLAQKNAEVKLMCLDASTFLTDIYHGQHPVVFFSATLTPLDYYLGLLDSASPQDPPERLNLPSPFPRENLLVLLETRLSTRFPDRAATMKPILQEILSAVRTRVGNYLVFLPSFGYLRQFRMLLKAQADRSDLDFVVQIPGMDEAQKQQFLQRFEQFGKRTLVGLAVMGSLFNEGIDLAGERLSGVIIVGVGLPQVSLPREIMSQYFSSRLGRGFEYAYQFPGFNKVQQAAGRVIRSEQDVGFVLLMDDRYAKPEYQVLFPDEWQPVTLSAEQPLIDVLSEFWADHQE